MPYLYGNLPNIEFKTYSEDTETSHIRVQDGKVEALYLNWDIEWYNRPFYFERVDEEMIQWFFSERVWEPGRVDLWERLAAIGVSEYNPLKICQKTHGLKYDDPVWIKFKVDGEWEDISWKDLEPLTK